ncbi:hypothetical protein V5F53_16900 [Xanthobacter sp. V4C-4]|uniref:hypothetical protein n=1 Tax=Xanthobacter cornucopiae TaxID=3119924 RepID=UPI0037296401
MTGDDLIAAEFVIGTLDAAERAQVRTRIAVDAAFAARVRTWERALVPLYELVTPIDPAPGLWRSIAEDLDSLRLGAEPAAAGKRGGRTRTAAGKGNKDRAKASPADGASSAAGGTAGGRVAGALRAPFQAMKGLMRGLRARRAAAKSPPAAPPRAAKPRRVPAPEAAASLSAAAPARAGAEPPPARARDIAHARRRLEEELSRAEPPPRRPEVPSQAAAAAPVAALPAPSDSPLDASTPPRAGVARGERSKIRRRRADSTSVAPAPPAMEAAEAPPAGAADRPKETSRPSGARERVRRVSAHQVRDTGRDANAEAAPADAPVDAGLEIAPPVVPGGVPPAVETPPRADADAGGSEAPPPTATGRVELSLSLERRRIAHPALLLGRLVARAASTTPDTVAPPPAEAAGPGKTARAAATRPVKPAEPSRPLSATPSGGGRAPVKPAAPAPNTAPSRPAAPGAPAPAPVIRTFHPAESLSLRARLLWGAAALAGVLGGAVGADMLAVSVGGPVRQPRTVPLVPVYMASPPPDVRLKLDVRSGLLDLRVTAPPAPPGRIYRLWFKTEAGQAHLLGSFTSSLFTVADVGPLMLAGAPGTARLSLTVGAVEDPDGVGDEIYSSRIGG